MFIQKNRLNRRFFFILSIKKAKIFKSRLELNELPVALLLKVVNLNK